MDWPEEGQEFPPRTFLVRACERASGLNTVIAPGIPGGYPGSGCLVQCSPLPGQRQCHAAPLREDFSDRSLTRQASDGQAVRQAGGQAVLDFSPDLAFAAGRAVGRASG